VVKFVKSLENTGVIPLCGAGITGPADIKKAYELGCKGVIMASAVADVHNPEKILKEISPYAHKS
jgi:thiazole synthase ThiGH ThiG subunit